MRSTAVLTRTLLRRLALRQHQHNAGRVVAWKTRNAHCSQEKELKGPLTQEAPSDGNATSMVTQLAPTFPLLSGSFSDNLAVKERS